jgi:succinate--hydroxymethylglutarate CoA-transferase
MSDQHDSKPADPGRSARATAGGAHASDLAEAPPPYQPAQLARPLQGYKVVDLTVWIQGPLAGQLLADLGAGVIKIEHPEHGDGARGLATLYGSSIRKADGTSLLWDIFNRSKRAIALDLKEQSGREILYRLIDEADVFVTNHQPRTLASLGALPQDLWPFNPRLVYALGLGLGRTGPFRDVPSQDTTGMAYSGFMKTAARADGEPVYLPGSLADVSAGTNLAFAILAALLGVKQDGIGRLATTSLLQSAMWMQMLNISIPANGAPPFQTFDRRTAANPLMNVYRCGDGQWIALGTPAIGDSMWRKVCAALGEPEELLKFTTVRLRLDSAATIIGRFDAIFAQRPAAHWIASLSQQGVPVAPVNDPEQLMEDESLWQEGVFGQTAHGLRFVRGPFTLAGNAPDAKDAPEHGQDSIQVLEELGLTGEELHAFLSGHG